VMITSCTWLSRSPRSRSAGSAPPRGWLLKAARKMEKAVTADFEEYARVR
jgi:hypothetical protein